MGSLYSSVELVPSTSSVHLTIALTDSIHSNDLLNQWETIDLPYSLCSECFQVTNVIVYELVCTIHI